MKKLIIAMMLITCAGLVSCKDENPGESGGTGTLTLVGPDKVTGETLTINKTFNVHFIQGPYGQSIDCVDNNNNLVVFTVKIPTENLPAATTVYDIVDDPLASDLAPNEVHIEYSDLTSGDIISYQSQNDGQTLTLTKSGDVYSFLITNLRLEEGPFYTNGPAAYYDANGSFEFK